MKPALSIVFFTVFSGGGLGLAAVLAVFAGSVSRAEFIAAAVLAVLFTGGGLCASVLHLANPKNAWRALSRVRTSWLSREAVCALVFFPLFGVWTLLEFFRGGENVLLRGAVFAAAMLTVFCTAMIYQSLKPIAAWHHPQTAFNYLMFSLQSGALLFAAVASFGGGAPRAAVVAVFVFTAAAAAGKILYYRRIGKAKGIRIGRAAGFLRARARLLDSGHTAQTFLTREFIFQQPAAKLQRLRIASFLLCVFAPPLGAAFATRGVCAAAVVLLFVGLLMERWLFFAEAKHAVRAYHGDGAP